MSRPVLGYVEPVDDPADVAEICGDVFGSRTGGSAGWLACHPAPTSRTGSADAASVAGEAGASEGSGTLSLRCGTCGQDMSLLLQLSAPESAGVTEAYCRLLYLFTCRDGRCATKGYSPSLRLVRGQCNKAGSKRAFHNTEALADGWLAVKELVSEPEPIDPSAQASSPSSKGGKKTEKADNSMGAEERDVAAVMAEDDGTESYQRVRGDGAFYRFERRLARAPEQVLRYLRVDQPSKARPSSTITATATTTAAASLRASASGAAAGQDRASSAASRVKAAQASGRAGKTAQTADDDDEDAWSDDDDAPALDSLAQMDALESAGGLWIASEGKLLDDAVPPCELCGGPRSAECQILPTLLSYLDEIDHTRADALDWGVLNLYTCDASCDVRAQGGYAEERVWRQEYDVKTGIS